MCKFLFSVKFFILFPSVFYLSIKKTKIGLSIINQLNKNDTTEELTNSIESEPNFSCFGFTQEIWQKMALKNITFKSKSHSSSQININKIWK